MEKPENRKNALLIWNVPADLKQKFKVKVFTECLTMREVIIDLMSQYVNSEVSVKGDTTKKE